MQYDALDGRPRTLDIVMSSVQVTRTVSGSTTDQTYTTNSIYICETEGPVIGQVTKGSMIGNVLRYYVTVTSCCDSKQTTAAAIVEGFYENTGLVGSSCGITVGQMLLVPDLPY
jgi:hypothetical protein